MKTGSMLSAGDGTPRIVFSPAPVVCAPTGSVIKPQSTKVASSKIEFFFAVFIVLKPHLPWIHDVVRIQDLFYLTHDLKTVTVLFFHVVSQFHAYAVGVLHGSAHRLDQMKQFIHCLFQDKLGLVVSLIFDPQAHRKKLRHTLWIRATMHSLALKTRVSSRATRSKEKTSHAGQ